jgi:chromate reductase
MLILGIAGSLREKSFNRALLRAAQELAPPEVTLEIFDLKGIPVFNQDEESDPPERVRQLKNRVQSADAILFATPEYNYSFSGALKNAIDWASRPYGENAWSGKPVAVMSASVGTLGGARAQYHLRQCFVYLNMLPLNSPEVMVPNAAKSFDDQGRLTNEASRDLVRKLLSALVAWTEQVEQMRLVPA